MTTQPGTWPSALLASDLEITLLGHTLCQGTWWRIPDRTLPDEHLIYIIQRGSMEASIAGHRHHVDAGRSLWLGPGTPHRFWLPQDDSSMLVYHLRFRTPVAIESPPGLAPRSAETESLIAGMHHEQRTPGPHAALRQRCSLVLLLTDLAQARDEADRERGLTPAQVRAVRSCVDRSDPAHRLEPADLAAAAGLAPSYFTRRFTPTFGCSPRTWLKRERIRRAAEVLVESTVAVGAIAELFGYDELFRFSRQFHEVMGCSPSAWRRRHAPPRRIR